jgi:osmotically-inducible protein OsmY
VTEYAATTRVGLHATLLAVCVVALARGGWAGSATPGPAARAGSEIDKAWGTVQKQVADALLTTRVRLALLEHLGSDGLHVQVQARDGVVELAGQVSKRSSQQLAGAVARSVSDVREVRNRISLSPNGEAPEAPIARAFGEAEHAVADALLETKVKVRLLEQLGKVAFDIEVEATDGVVSLSGTVPDAARRDLAGKIAKGTGGVKELHDLLKVGQ